MTIKTIKNLSAKMFVFSISGSKEKFRLAPATGEVEFPENADEAYAQALAKAGKVELTEAKAKTTKATSSASAE